MADRNQRTNTGNAATIYDLIVDGLPPCSIEMVAAETWRIVAQLTSDHQTAFVAAALSPDVLCQRAQHALGLAGIGSRIAPNRDAIGVYIPTSPAPFGTTPLVLDGHALLWAISCASSETIQSLITAAIEVMRTASTSSSS